MLRSAGPGSGGRSSRTAACRRASIVPEAIVRLREQRAEIQVEAGEASGEELGAMVAAGELHVAVCFQDAAAPRREHDGALRTDLEQEPFMALLPPGHPLAGTGHPSPSQTTRPSTSTSVSAYESGAYTSSSPKSVPDVSGSHSGPCFRYPASGSCSPTPNW